jgi:hypothetical protein
MVAKLSEPFEPDRARLCRVAVFAPALVSRARHDILMKNRQMEGD